ncbi:MAG: CdaR family protein [Desulfocucumaceae bacterium]
MGGIDWRNMSLRIMSVLLALLLWIYVTNEQNPVHNQILSINLVQRGLPQGMVVSGNVPHNVSVRVQGTRGQITALTATDFEALLDLSEVKEGDQTLTVKINSPAGVQVTQVTPARVNVAVESIIEQQVQIATALKGSPARGYIALDPVILPSTVTVKGPRSKVALVTQVSVAADVEGASRQVEKMLPLTIPQSGVSVFPQIVKVTVPIIQMPSKSVPLKAGVTGSPAAGYEITGITVNPGEVLVSAPAEVLAGLKLLETEKIDLRGTDRDITVKTTVIPPAGVIEIKPVAVEAVVHLKKTVVEAPPDGSTTTNPPATTAH